MAAMGQPVVAQSGDSTPKEPLIHADGSGRVQRVPDRVDISIGIEAIDTTALSAQAGAEKVMKAAVAAIRDLKLTDEELQTGSVDLSPSYEDTNGRPSVPAKIIGYTASIALIVRTSNLTSPAQIIDAALKAGCNRIHHVSFTLKELLEAREEAITLAAKAAKRKAQVMADALEMKLVRLAQASTTSGGGWWGDNRFGNLVQMNASISVSGGSQGDAMVPGKIDVTAEVALTFVAAPRG